jgi:hypothetical protein
MILICPNLSSKFGFSIFLVIQFQDTNECETFSLRILTSLCVFGEYGESI